MEKLYEFICDHEDMVVTARCTIEDNLELAEKLANIKEELPEALDGTELMQVGVDWTVYIINDDDYEVGYPIELEEADDLISTDDVYWEEIEPKKLTKRISKKNSYNLISFENNRSIYDGIVLIQHEKEIAILDFSILMSGWNSFIEKLAECSLLSAEEAENLKLGGKQNEEK